MTADLGDAIREILPSARADLERLVRIPSVSADPDATRHVWASAAEVASECAQQCALNALAAVKAEIRNADQLFGEWRRFVQAAPDGFIGSGDTGTGNCQNPVDGVLGLSPGWGDVYRWQRPGQYVEFGGNGDGRYVVRSTVDHLNHVLESNDSNNSAYALIKVLSREHGVQRFQILANQTRRSGEGPDLFQKIARVCDRFLNVSLEFAGSVPFDDYLRRAVQRQTAVVDAYPACISSIALKNLALKADKWSVPQGARGHLEFFVERMVGTRIGPSTVLQ